MRKFIKICDIILLVLLGATVLTGVYPYFIRKRYPTIYRPIVEKYAEESGLSPALVFAVIKAESGFQADAVSKKGAVGLMQITPSTAKFVAERHGYDFMEVYLTDPEYNVRTGCYYLAYLRARFPEEETLLAAYNAGEGTVRTWLADERYSREGGRLTHIPYRETQTYLRRVLFFKNKYKKHYSFS